MSEPDSSTPGTNHRPGQLAVAVGALVVVPCSASTVKSPFLKRTDSRLCLQ